jgi:hypothetical protein
MWMLPCAVLQELRIEFRIPRIVRPLQFMRSCLDLIRAARLSFDFELKSGTLSTPVWYVV